LRASWLIPFRLLRRDVDIAIVELRGGAERPEWVDEVRAR
jgi:hypothetical protein